jgi:hypothetical protein
VIRVRCRPGLVIRARWPYSTPDRPPVQSDRPGAWPEKSTGPNPSSRIASTAESRKLAVPGTAARMFCPEADQHPGGVDRVHIGLSDAIRVFSYIVIGICLAGLVALINEIRQPDRDRDVSKSYVNKS